MQTKLGPFTIYYSNSEELHSLKREVWGQDQYYFESENAAPIIIDAGANIGLSTLYFKKLYPASQITAIEPLPQNFTLLEQNIFENEPHWERHTQNSSNSFTDPSIKLHQIALATHTGKLTLHTDQENNWHSTASIIKGNWTRTQNTHQIEVDTRTLKSIIQEIDQPIDLLKIDIEGLEQKVLTHAGKDLLKIKQIICEFHPGPEQNLGKLVKFLEELEFEVELLKKNKPVQLKKATGLIMIHAKQN